MTKVLIVDDDALVRLAVRTILTSHGLELVGEPDAGARSWRPSRSITRTWS